MAVPATGSNPEKEKFHTCLSWRVTFEFYTYQKNKQ